jgi:hypothetical protein
MLREFQTQRRTSTNASMSNIKIFNVKIITYKMESATLGIVDIMDATILTSSSDELQ